MSYITYKQADSRWGNKNYNGSSNMATAGCGPTSVAMLAYAVDGKTDPWDVAKFMKNNGFAIRNNGTAWAGIPAAMKHYGLKDVRNVAKMDDIFKLLSKGYCAVFLMRAGSRGGVCWTTAGHYIAVTDYKVKNGKHYLYTRDSGGRNHTGWYCYETQMRGLIPQVWCGYVPGMLKSGQTTTKKATLKAIDVSEHQGTINWKKVKAAGINYAIIRAGYGKNNPDGCFKENIEGAIKAGIKHIGIYWFMYSYTEEMARNEAKYCIKAIEPYREHINMFVSSDWEYASMNYAEKCGKNPSKTLITKMNKAFCEEIKAAGYTPAVYYNYDYKKNHMDLDKLPYINWYALDDSNGKFTSVAMQQYGTTSIDGIGGKVDINWIHDTAFIKSPEAKTTTTTTSATSGAYPGEFPSTKMVKTNAEVINDSIKFLKWIAGDNSFHYGHGADAHHNGCYFCDTQKLKKGHGIVDPEHTYCCNPLIGAAWAHGGGIPQAMKMCRNCSSWDFKKGHGYDKSSLFDNLGKPAKSKLKPGDVLCEDTHVAMYIGSGKIAEASGGDDNKKGSKKWNNSIHIVELTDKRYSGFKRVHRFNGSVNTTCCISHGEVGRRVELTQAFLKWYGYDLKVDGLFGDVTLKYVKAFQKAAGIAQDGIVGPNTIRAMKNVKKATASSATAEKTFAEKTLAWGRKIAKDDSYHYVKWISKDPKTHECPVCHGHPNGDYHGWNCIGFSFACWRHGGGLKSKCSCGVISNEVWEKILFAKTDAEALEIARKKIGIKDIKVIRNVNGIKQSSLKAADICSSFDGETYKHTWMYSGSGKMLDCTHGKTQISERKALTAKIAIRYVGK